MYAHNDEFDETPLSFEVLGRFFGMQKRGRKGIRRRFFLVFIHFRHDGLLYHD